MAESTYTDQVYDHILGQLLSCELRPGEFVDRKQIARNLDVSLIPVSDAVQRLTYEGFLTTRRRCGTFVCSPGAEEIRGQLLLREALECQAARLYSGQPIRREKTALRQLASAADQAADAAGSLWFEDFEFHRALVALTNTAALTECFQRVIKLSMFHQTAVIVPMQQATYDRHVDLLDDLLKLSPDAAEARMRKHIRSGKEAFLGATP